MAFHPSRVGYEDEEERREGGGGGAGRPQNPHHHHQQQQQEDERGAGLRRRTGGGGQGKRAGGEEEEEPRLSACSSSADVPHQRRRGGGEVPGERSVGAGASTSSSAHQHRHGGREGDEGMRRRGGQQQGGGGGGREEDEEDVRGVWGCEASSRESGLHCRRHVSHRSSTNEEEGGRRRRRRRGGGGGGGERIGDDEEVDALHASIDYVGQTIETSKVKYTWLLSIRGSRHQVDFLHSKMSGKKRLVVDGHTIYEQQVMRAHKFLYSWPVAEHLLSIVFESADGHFHLTIDGLPFSYFTQRNRLLRNPHLARQEQRAHSTAFAPHAQSYLSSSSSFRPREEENHSVVAVTSPSAYAPSVSMPPVCPRYPPSTHTKTPEVSKVSTQGQEGSGVHTPQRTAQEVSSLHPHSHARVSFSSQRQPQAFSQTNAETQHAGMAGSMSSLPPSSARFNASPCSPHPHPAHSSEEEARRRERRKKAEGTKQREEPPDSHASFPGRQDLRAGPGGSLEGGGRIRRSEGQAGREQEGAEEDKREAEEEKGEGGGAKTAEDVDLLDLFGSTAPPPSTALSSSSPSAFSVSSSSSSSLITQLPTSLVFSSSSSVSPSSSSNSFNAYPPGSACLHADGFPVSSLPPQNDQAPPTPLENLLLSSFLGEEARETARERKEDRTPTPSSQSLAVSPANVSEHFSLKDSASRQPYPLPHIRKSFLADRVRTDSPGGDELRLLAGSASPSHEGRGHAGLCHSTPPHASLSSSSSPSSSPFSPMPPSTSPSSPWSGESLLLLQTRPRQELEKDSSQRHVDAARRSPATLHRFQQPTRQAPQQPSGSSPLPSSSSSAPFLLERQHEREENKEAGATDESCPPWILTSSNRLPREDVEFEREERRGERKESERREALEGAGVFSVGVGVPSRESAETKKNKREEGDVSFLNAFSVSPPQHRDCLLPQSSSPTSFSCLSSSSYPLKEQEDREEEEEERPRERHSREGGRKNATSLSPYSVDAGREVSFPFSVDGAAQPGDLRPGGSSQHADERRKEEEEEAEKKDFSVERSGLSHIAKDMIFKDVSSTSFSRPFTEGPPGQSSTRGVERGNISNTQHSSLFLSASSSKPQASLSSSSFSSPQSNRVLSPGTSRQVFSPSVAGGLQRDFPTSQESAGGHSSSAPPLVPPHFDVSSVRLYSLPSSSAILQSEEAKEGPGEETRLKKSSEEFREPAGGELDRFSRDFFAPGVSSEREKKRTAGLPREGGGGPVNDVGDGDRGMVENKEEAEVETRRGIRTRREQGNEEAEANRQQRGRLAEERGRRKEEEEEGRRRLKEAAPSSQHDSSLPSAKTKEEPKEKKDEGAADPFADLMALASVKLHLAPAHDKNNKPQ